MTVPLYRYARHRGKTFRPFYTSEDDGKTRKSAYLKTGGEKGILLFFFYFVYIAVLPAVEGMIKEDSSNGREP